MKRFNDIMDKYMYMSFIKRWLISIPFLFVFLYSFIYILLKFTILEVSHGATELTMTTVAELSLLLSVIMGLFVSVLYGGMRDSAEFWAAANEFEMKVEAAKTKDDVQALYTNEFHLLRKKCGGGPHINELNRLFTLVNTKYKYMTNMK